MLNFPAKILTIRLSSIGDIVLTTGLYGRIKKQFPNTVIHTLVKKEFAELLNDHPHIDRVLTFDSAQNRNQLRYYRDFVNKENYEFVADLHNNLRSRLMTRDVPGNRIARMDKLKWERFLLVQFKINKYRHILQVPDRYFRVFDGLGLQDDGSGLALHWSEKAEAEVASAVDLPEKFIAIAPGAAFYTKTWPCHRFVELAKQLIQQYGISIVWLGGPKERALNDCLREAGDTHTSNLIGQLSLLQNAIVLQKAALLITNDSSLLHIAAAVNTPVTAIFGSSVQEFGFTPFRVPAKVVESADVSCRPCSHIGRNQCPKKHFDCMQKISVTAVREQVEALAIEEDIL